MGKFPRSILYRVTVALRAKNPIFDEISIHFDIRADSPERAIENAKLWCRAYGLDCRFVTAREV
jgi:hypothetical protein